jgi:hypothetical protein
VFGSLPSNDFETDCGLIPGVLPHSFWCQYLRCRWWYACYPALRLVSPLYKIPFQISSGPIAPILPSCSLSSSSSCSLYMVLRIRSVAFPRCTNSSLRRQQLPLSMVTLEGATSLCAPGTGSSLVSLMCVSSYLPPLDVLPDLDLDHRQLWCVIQMRKKKRLTCSLNPRFSYRLQRSGLLAACHRIPALDLCQSLPSRWSRLVLHSLRRCTYGLHCYMSHDTLSLGLRHYYGSLCRCAPWGPSHARPRTRGCLRRSPSTICCCGAPRSIRCRSRSHPTLLGRYLCHQRRAHRRIQHLDL